MIVSPEAAKALAMQHRAELRAMTERDALIVADQLLAMAAIARYPIEKERSQGLIERQRILYRITK
ncbi:MAG: hypothetical protein ACO3JG_12300 [Luteolibacter sp.]